MSKTITKYILNLAKNSRTAAIGLSCAAAKDKNKCLLEMSRDLKKNSLRILRANEKDLATAKKSSCSAAFIDRLKLTVKRVQEMSEGLAQIAKLPDPVGRVIKEWTRPNGLRIKKVRVPIGVIAIIYESRPNVTSDCAGLCLKSGNSVILRGGREAFNTNLALYRMMQPALKRCGFSENAISFVETTDYTAVSEMLKLSSYIDLVIPRGGPGLIRQVAKRSRIPVIKHYMGICHIYVDKDADLAMAESVCFNAKVQRPATCNAMETMLVHKDIALEFLPAMLAKFQSAGVEIRGCHRAKKTFPDIILANDRDYRTEYLDLILSLKIVDGFSEAVEHIREYGSRHSEAIITRNKRTAADFLQAVDSACVYVNASTRFTDGYQFGFGAEIGISTDKIHARGPMGLEELTSYKYEVFGSGQIRK